MKSSIAFIFISLLLVTSSFTSKIDVEVCQFDRVEDILSRENDTTYVLNFWATWCRPCVKELHLFEELHEQYANQPVKVILVSLDFPNELNERLIPFINARNLQTTQFLLDDADANSWIPRVDSSWSGAIPATHIHKGESTAFHEGEIDSLTLNNQFLTIYNNKQ